MHALSTLVLVVGLALVLSACASSGAGGGAAEGSTVEQWVDISNQSGEPVTVTARVGAGEVQPLGFFGPAEQRRVRINTGAATTDEIYVDARNDRTGNHATTTMKVVPGQTLRWDIQF
jgi:hypothetical protein